MVAVLVVDARAGVRVGGIRVSGTLAGPGLDQELEPFAGKTAHAVGDQGNPAPAVAASAPTAADASSTAITPAARALVIQVFTPSSR